MWFYILCGGTMTIGCGGVHPSSSRDSGTWELHRHVKHMTHQERPPVCFMLLMIC